MGPQPPNEGDHAGGEEREKTHLDVLAILSSSVSGVHSGVVMAVVVVAARQCYSWHWGNSHVNGDRPRAWGVVVMKVGNHETRRAWHHEHIYIYVMDG